MPDTDGSVDGNLSIAEFCDWAGIGKTKAYEEIRTNRLSIKKCGVRTLVPMRSAKNWLECLPGKKRS